MHCSVCPLRVFVKKVSNGSYTHDLIMISGSTWALTSRLQPVAEAGERRPLQPSSRDKPPDMLTLPITRAVVFSRTLQIHRRDAEVWSPSCMAGARCEPSDDHSWHSWGVQKSIQGLSVQPCRCRCRCTNCGHRQEAMTAVQWHAHKEL